MSNLNSYEFAHSGVDMKRSVFPRPQDVKFTFDAGVLVPFNFIEVLPGDTIKMDMNFVIRQSTLLKPVMDCSYFDVYYIFVPNRLVWDDYAKFLGENDNAWIPVGSYSIPQISFSNISPKSVADYLGLPPGLYNVNPLVVSALPFRAYAKAFNDYFRDENLQQVAGFSRASTISTGSSNNFHPDNSPTDYVTSAGYGGSLCPVNRYHDRFSSCLPAPQKGPAVTIPLTGNAPVKADTSSHALGNPLKFGFSGGSYSGTYALYTQSPSSLGSVVANTGSTSSITAGSITTTNLFADLSTVTSATINDLRFAFQLQKFYERAARGGSRMIEFLQSQYGVKSSDARLQRAEFLCGKHFPLNVGTVFQTSASSSGSTDQANEAAYSVTSDQGSYFVKSFEEPGIILGLCCVRTDHTYQQGVEAYWFKKNLTDFYLPVFANIGEQPVYTREIYLDTSNLNRVFGFNEAWSDYRYAMNRVSGEFRSSYTTPLDSWHYADDYSGYPTLNASWIHETKKNINRTLAVTTQSQFIADIYEHPTFARVMPLYSVPGLIDHH